LVWFYAACHQAFSPEAHQGRPLAAERASSTIRPAAAFPARREAAGGPQWVHEIKLDGFRMAARIDHGGVQLLTRTGLEWTAKYPGAAEALAALNVTNAYLDGELCGVGEAGLSHELLMVRSGSEMPAAGPLARRTKTGKLELSLHLQSDC
jgi:ATP-dependent DNA ligase